MVYTKVLIVQSLVYTKVLIVQSLVYRGYRYVLGFLVLDLVYTKVLIVQSLVYWVIVLGSVAVVILYLCFRALKSLANGKSFFIATKSRAKKKNYFILIFRK